MIQNMMSWMKKKINDIPTCGESFVLQISYVFFFHVILVSFLIIVVESRQIGYWGNENVHDEDDIDNVEFDEEEDE